MKRFCLIFLAVSSILLSRHPAQAAQRPRYGGTLRVAMKEAPASFDPATLASGGTAGVCHLVFETLVTLNDRGRPQPLLASFWEADPGNQRWRFSLRSGVSFHDGMALDANAVVASLRAANPAWKVQPAGMTVVIETDSPAPDLPAQLALARNGISRSGSGRMIGTGPFMVALWNAANHVTLNANDQYWGGRPFLNSIEIDFGKNYQAQGVLFDLGKTDVIEVAPENIHRAQAITEDRVILSSQPSELMALVFAAGPHNEDESHARNALATNIDAVAINNVVLQGGGEPAATLLPNWLSGYAFLFADPNVRAANIDSTRQERPRTSSPWTLGYDASDPISRLIAERILLNARDAGISLQLTSSAAAEVKLIRIPLLSLDPSIALSELARILQLPEPKLSNAADTYSTESALLRSQRILPLLHLRSTAALHNGVHGWSASPLGEWHIENVWVSDISISSGKQ